MKSKSSYSVQNNIKDISNKSVDNSVFLFERKNYKYMLLGVAFITIGFILMSGGSSTNPEVFNPDIYSFRRIRLAPTLVLIGLGIQVYAILTTTKVSKNKK